MGLGSRPLLISGNQIVDFVTWLLFNKTYKGNSKPPHILCQGVFRASTTWQQGNRPTASSLPGLTVAYPNEHAESFKTPEWSSILALLGDGGDRLMTHLLMSCGLFQPIDGGLGTYYQLSGTYPMKLSQQNLIQCRAKHCGAEDSRRIVPLWGRLVSTKFSAIRKTAGSNPPCPQSNLIC